MRHHGSMKEDLQVR